MGRPDQDTYFMRMAKLVATRGTCARRRVGCVLIDEHRHVLATGYNGVPAGLPHCIDTPCAGAEYASGEKLDECEAVHAEANALLQCRDVQQIMTCYVTCSPCITCLRMLLNTSCREIVFEEDYPMQRAKVLWEMQGRVWNKWMDPATGENPSETNL